ncbi:alkaline phosphatase [Radiobacillus kanasensis]|uniref:alkaline phosphatase n=1 Tax=Radiobacillus kanasensis TaxID=2844358 RepID=UPI001E5069E6|nr:alkaline phosphatase [Radiobacillus kanasensis]UFU00686.1 alkaline phosphatase [Radiobacillus kanasensis]
MREKRNRKKIIIGSVITALVAGSLLGTFSTSEAKSEKKHNRAKIKNVILMIGDGMGPAYNTMYRYYKDDPKTPEMEETLFDQHFIGKQVTYSFDHEENITDSAAAATSMAAGIKTYNGAISVDMEKERVKTVLEQAKDNGMATGLVSTSQINHATPAAFGAHDVSRSNYNEIADDYYDELVNGKHKVDVMLGGGTDYFVREDRNLVEQFKEDGYSYVDNRQELLKDKNDQVLGLFAPVGMDKMIDRGESTPSLKEMTNSALDRLKSDKDGFFLMVEGSQIDWAGHDNDVVGAMSEMEDFESAFQAAINFARKDKHTLVILTADHSTGGLAIGSNGQYNWNAEPIKAAQKTPDFIANKIVEGMDVEKALSQYIDLDLTTEEINSVKDATETGDVVEVDNAIEQIFDVRSGTGWTTGGHTGVDVNVYGYGPRKEMFSGLIDNTETGNLIFDILK